MKFYRCKHCGQIVVVVKETGVPLICCGERMEELTPSSVDASLEKHVPVYEVKDGVVNVKVGSVEHPMTEQHYIEWVVVQTKNGYQIKNLKPNDKPEASFLLVKDDEVESVYAYCNLHGLWKA